MINHLPLHLSISWSNQSDEQSIIGYPRRKPPLTLHPLPIRAIGSHSEAYSDDRVIKGVTITVLKTNPARKPGW